MTNPTKATYPPLVHANETNHRRLLAESIRSVMDGKLLSTGSATLTANVATTAVVDYRLGNNTVILFQPMTANAAAEIGAGTMYVKTTDYDIPNRTFTINHANNAQTDRVFRYFLVG